MPPTDSLHWVYRFATHAQMDQDWFFLRYCTCIYKALNHKNQLVNAAGVFFKFTLEAEVCNFWITSITEWNCKNNDCLQKLIVSPQTHAIG